MNKRGADQTALIRRLVCTFVVRKPGRQVGKRELVALLSLSSWCLVIEFVVWLFLAVPLVCLQFVIVVFPDHTHYFFSPRGPYYTSVFLGTPCTIQRLKK